MGTVVRYERSWSPPRGVSCAHRSQSVRRSDTYIPIPASDRTVPYRSVPSFLFKIVLFFIFFEFGKKEFEWANRGKHPLGSGRAQVPPLDK